MKKIFLVLLTIVLAGCGTTVVSTVTPALPTVTATATEQPTPTATSEPTVCLPDNYNWKFGGKEAFLKFKTETGHEFVRLHIASTEEISSLEGGLLADEYWIIINAPKTLESGVILRKGEVRELRRADKKSGKAEGYAFGVCNGTIFIAPLPEVDAPPEDAIQPIIPPTLPTPKEGQKLGKEIQREKTL
ncbi:MAG: hypothetical protein UT10_C0031G0003 [Candidatus Woesebacteria bacterium GW2011_GWB1_38_8b]|uniref:Lipoprotein n=1 Tax=Candidatus Woesebacteria bacterium GW2011_GWB1_38_8b TaxID=1618571 RepID=A0A0G0PA09_9BACT|nr:MAG: hypothetical protein UT10_C0031G0003 [Candidatus Woesebacteria bacterium GW2011_GWB1_38_8b]